MGGTKNAQKQRMKALAKARAVATAKRKEAKRLGIPLSEVQLPPSAAELEFLAAQEKEKQVRNFDPETYGMLKWGACYRWSSGPNSACDSIETTTIGKTHRPLHT